MLMRECGVQQVFQSLGDPEAQTWCSPLHSLTQKQQSDNLKRLELTCYETSVDHSQLDDPLPFKFVIILNGKGSPNCCGQHGYSQFCWLISQLKLTSAA